MGAPNFNYNSGKIYAIQDMDEQFEWDDRIERIKETLKEHGFSINNDEAIVGEKKELIEMYSRRHTLRLRLSIQIEDGRYSGAQLIPFVTVKDTYGNEFDMEEDEEYIKQAIEEGIEETTHPTKKEKEKEIAATMVQVKTTVAKMQAEGDSLCATMCDEVMECIGIFGNGEAVYKQVEKISV